MNTLQIKLYFKDEIRRLTITTATTYNEFVQKVQGFLNQNSEVTKHGVEDYTFKYLDKEEDWVSFSSNEEWKEALVNFNDVLKIKIQTKRSIKEKHCRYGERHAKRFFSPFNFHIYEPKEQEGGFESIFVDILDEIQKLAGSEKRECPYDLNSILTPENIERAKNFVSQFAGEDFTKIFEEVLGNVQKEINENPSESKQEENKEQTSTTTEKPAKEEQKQEEEEIILDEAPKQSAQENKVEQVEYPKVEQKVEDKFENSNYLLKQMGFDQDSVNRYLLQKYNGDLQKVIFELLNQ